MGPTVAELGDGRLLMLIRTHWGRFWEALWEDSGLSWRTVRPSAIAAPSGPGHLVRLQNGRVFFVSNPPPDRQELACVFSEYDGRSWTKPLPIARQKGAQLSYPYAFERRPRELWIIAGFAFLKGWQEPTPLRLKANEDQLLQESMKPS